MTTSLLERTRRVPAQEQAWRRQAACRKASPELFDELDDRFAVEAAKRWCADCPVAQQCLAAGTLTHAYGTWGGRELQGGRIVA